MKMLFLPLALALAPWSNHALGTRALEPPSSLEPPATAAKARLTYAHVVVRECSPRRGPRETACAERSQPANTETQLELSPLPGAGLQRREKDTRSPIRLVLGSGEGGKSVELGPGAWELRWPAYRHEERFMVQSGNPLDVVLRSTAGRCELDPSGTCKLDAAATRKRVRITVQEG